jgi:hypothetical protein
MEFDKWSINSLKFVTILSVYYKGGSSLSKTWMSTNDHLEIDNIRSSDVGYTNDIYLF